MYTIINYTNLKSYIVIVYAVIGMMTTPLMSNESLLFERRVLQMMLASIPDDGRDIHDAHNSQNHL